MGTGAHLHLPRAGWRSLNDTAAAAPLATRLLVGGRDVYTCMLAGIASARRRVRIETYIWKSGFVADRFLQSLHAAAARGVHVELLIDAFGCESLGDHYFNSLRAAGARVVRFNPHKWLRGSFRDHRKLLTIDGEMAVVGGLNIADEYDGDGVESGWRDFAVELRGPIVCALDASLDEMFALAEFTPMTLARFASGFRRRRRKSVVQEEGPSARLLVSGAGTRSGRLQRTLRRDVSASSDLTAYAAYLLPTGRIRRAMRRVARRGSARVIVGARSDVPLVQWAAERLYPFWLRGGVKLYEYQPQLVHAKLIAIDDIVYVGSANLDIRSLRINYELLVRIESRALAAQVRQTFEADLARCREIDRATWRRERRWWYGLRSLWAYLLLVRLDPFLTRRGLSKRS